MLEPMINKNRFTDRILFEMKKNENIKNLKF